MVLINCDVKDCRQEEKGTTEDEIAGWHHQLAGIHGVAKSWTRPSD